MCTIAIRFWQNIIINIIKKYIIILLSKRHKNRQLEICAVRPSYKKKKNNNIVVELYYLVTNNQNTPCGNSVGWGEVGGERLQLALRLQLPPKYNILHLIKAFIFFLLFFILFRKPHELESCYRALNFLCLDLNSLISMM